MLGEKKKRFKRYEDMSEFISHDIDDNRPPAARNMPLEREGDRDREARYIVRRRDEGKHDIYRRSSSIANRPPDRAQIRP